MIKLLKTLAAPLLAILISVSGTLITTRVQLAEIATTVSSAQQISNRYNEKISADISSLKAKQDALFELYYVPRRDEWQKLIVDVQKISSSVSDLERANQIIRDDMHRYHPTAYSGGGRGRY